MLGREMKMPIDNKLKKTILDYCDRDLPTDSEVKKLFDFVDDDRLKDRLDLEYYAARYVYKLGEALAVEEARLHAHVKFQIVQYAGIYEALIVWMLWKKFNGHKSVESIQASKKIKKLGNLPKTISSKSNMGENIFLCIELKSEIEPESIKFDSKVKAAVDIGFLHEPLGEEIKKFYKLRNAIHLESAVKKDINFELDNSRLAYRRIFPFTNGLRGFIKDGKLPADAMIGV